MRLDPPRSLLTGPSATVLANPPSPLGAASRAPRHLQIPRNASVCPAGLLRTRGVFNTGTSGINPRMRPIPGSAHACTATNFPRPRPARMRVAFSRRSGLGDPAPKAPPCRAGGRWWYFAAGAAERHKNTRILVSVFFSMEQQAALSTNLQVLPGNTPGLLYREQVTMIERTVQ